MNLAGSAPVVPARSRSQSGQLTRRVAGEKGTGRGRAAASGGALRTVQSDASAPRRGGLLAVLAVLAVLGGLALIACR